MTQEEITHLMTAQDKQTVGHYNQVGVRNVSERIKLLYGQDYGLSYDSVKGEYTNVTVTLPLETAQTRKEERSDV